VQREHQSWRRSCSTLCARAWRITSGRGGWNSWTSCRRPRRAKCSAINFENEQHWNER